MAEHRTSVHYQLAWREWRAECRCGWIGSHLRELRLAEQEAEAHTAPASSDLGTGDGEGTGR